ncbi:MAG: hypothetical protein CMJ78_16765 [Planctomycetaceae bacterium]|nr:hypothetical protein [Planctomycetaceae bacterium]
MTKTQECAEFRASMRYSRRNALRIGGAAGLSLTLPTLMRHQAAASDSGSATFGVAKRVIMLYLHGGHPQQETFDPKPNGPSAVRGEFSAISTSLPGVQFSEMLPQIAKLADRMSIIRSMSHENANHVQASYPANTGHKHPPELKSRGDFPPSPDHFPPFGAVMDKFRPSGRALPNWVRIGPLMRRSNGTVLHGQISGMLGAKHSSFVVDQKLLPKDVQIEAVRYGDDLTSVRLNDRQNLLKQIDEHARLIDESVKVRSFDQYYQRGFNLLCSNETRTAFDLASEPAAIRERYGKTEFGQRCLLARRLVEAGVPITNVSYCHTPRGSWDTHSSNFSKMKDSLAPTLDTAFSALFEDLEERGLLDETLVVINAEFGRTPKINSRSGRDHWPWVYSLALAGSGAGKGSVFGSSDESAAYPASHGRDPKDFAATLYHLLGIPPNTLIHDAVNRPHQLILGRPIHEILA